MSQYPILQTKLYIPPIRPELVSRPRLIERLSAGPHRKLTLVSAPAGYGKTTLVSEWVHKVGAHRDAPQIAWLSLDEGDNDATRFLAYIVAALRTIEADIAKGVLSAIQSPQPPPAEVVLTSLINDVAALPDPMVLVLDDYHVIEAQPIHDALTPVPSSHPGSIDRASRRGPAFYNLRSRRISQPGDGPGPFGEGHRRAGKTYRGVDCRFATGCDFNAGT
jgi:ATP/maltotriose-dependent transcriptional regulator MalT